MAHPLNKGFSFRTRLAMRIPIALAVGFWALMLMLVLNLAVFGEHFLPATAYLGILFFCIFWIRKHLLLLDIHDRGHRWDYHCGTRIVSMASWRDIISVSVLNPYFPGYEVTTRGEAFGFSGMVFSEHQRIYELIVAYSKHGDRG